MDQACAFGNKPILMTFDGDVVTIKKLNIKQDLYLIIINLGGEKNTQKILKSLHKCYPFAKNRIEENVQQYLGMINQAYLQEATKILQEGNARLLGDLMNQVQKDFDRYLIPACPEQLTAPKLHNLLKNEGIQPFIYGGKGVGSQGDGSVQLVAKNRASQEKIMAIVKQNFPEMQSLKLTINNN